MNILIQLILKSGYQYEKIKLEIYDLFKKRFKSKLIKFDLFLQNIAFNSRPRIKYNFIEY